MTTSAFHIYAIRSSRMYWCSKLTVNMISRTLRFVGNPTPGTRFLEQALKQWSACAIGCVLANRHLHFINIYLCPLT